MLDMGFIRDIRKILALLPPRRQNLLFSATFSDEIRRLAAGCSTTRPRSRSRHATRRPSSSPRSSTWSTASASASCSAISSRPAGSTRRWSSPGPSTARTGSPSSSSRDGILATAIHGNKSQPQRVRALADFKAGRFAILVATEVAARGLDIEALPHVVNFELPMVPEDYVHRIGRTGRAGVDGDAVSLVCVDELKLLNDIERVLGRGIPRETIPGFEPDPRIRPEPILRGGLGGSRPSRSMSGAGAPRHGGAPRYGGGPRPGGVTRVRWVPRVRPVCRQRPGTAPRPRATAQWPSTRWRPTRWIAPGNRGAGFAGPRRPGQGIGNGRARARPPAASDPDPAPAATARRDRTDVAAATASRDPVDPRRGHARRASRPTGWRPARLTRR